MQLHAEVAWKRGTSYSLEQISQILKNYTVNTEEALNMMIPVVLRRFTEPISLAVICGSSTNRSVFLFYLGTPESSIVVGRPLQVQSLESLTEDWEFLLRKIKESKIDYDVEYAHFRLNDKKLVKNTLTKFILKNENLAFLVSSSGVVPIASALATGTLSVNILFSSGVGFFIWLAICYYSFKKKGDYDIEP